MAALDGPPPLLRETPRRPAAVPSAARAKVAKGFHTRVPLSGVDVKRPIAPIAPKLRNLVKPTRQIVPESNLDPTCPTLCGQCSLPLGDHFYTQEGKGHVHGECMAQLLFQGLQESEDKRNQEDDKEKSERRMLFDIGWKQDSIPRNSELKCKLTDMAASQGMCCLALSDNSQSLRLAATCEPSAAVNLEYLSIALQVRRKDGVEPRFSLDPVQQAESGKDEDCRHRSQVKRFIPEWLAGTSVGDVLFQADYHLKELSMGDYGQPVVGMKSCFDYFQEGTESDKEWSGREWFLVRQAQVQLSEDSVLIPVVKMGVEAREQFCYDGAIMDAPITRKNHPMVKYADAFTKNFDLIAERKSVIYHLREVAKASVLAKYLLESGIHVHQSWFNLADEATQACALEVPQLWNERLQSKICVKDGEIFDDNESLSTGFRGIYGGVDFGLAKFQVARPTSRPVGQKMPIMAIKAVGLDKFQLPKPVGPQFTSSTQADLLTTQAPGQLSALARLPPSVRLEQFALDRFQRVRPSMIFATPPILPLPLSLPEIPSALQNLKVPAPVASAIAQMLPAKEKAKAAAAGVVAKPVEVMGRVGAQRRGLLAGGVLARGPVPSTVSQVAYAAPERIAMPMPLVAPSLSFAAPGVPALAISAALPAPAVALQGVDLNLNQFSLDTIEKPVEGLWKCDPHSEVAAVDMVEAFWASLDGEKASAFEKDDFALFKGVFNPHLSDRRAERDCFTIPDTNGSYINKLQSLVKAEEEIRQQRKDNFYSSDFHQQNPGPLFPSTWASSLEVSGTKVSEDSHSQRDSLQLRSDYQNAAVDILKSATPAFHKKTEEGVSFRIYRVGSLEVRSTQDHDGEEIVGAVFSVNSPTIAFRCAGNHERIQKVSEYVCKGTDSSTFHYYVVFETENGNTILSEEQVRDGSFTWVDNPADLEVRNGLAKVIRFAGCEGVVTVQDMKMYRDQLVPSDCQDGGKAYAASAYAVAVHGLDMAELM